MSTPVAAWAIVRLERRILGYGKRTAIVAFSGGVDSSVVLATSVRALGAEGVLAVTAVSPSLPAGELDQARSVARGLAVAHRVMETHEVDDDLYARNDALRCFHCKTHLYDVLSTLTAADMERDSVVLGGANADDVDDFRPGLLAARRYGVRNPLLEEGISKEAVRSIARQLGLSVADKPAMACLASRVAYGLAITPGLLRRIDLAEQAVRALGFASVRVRHRGETAVIEVPRSDIGRLLEKETLAATSQRIRDLGWPRVVVDPAGLRSGSMNAGLQFSQPLRHALSALGPRAGN